MKTLTLKISDRAFEELRYHIDTRLLGSEMLSAADEFLLKVMRALDRGAGELPLYLQE